MPFAASHLRSDTFSAGFSVAEVGDFNGDGIQDYVIGGPYGGSGDGRAYLVYGDDDGLPQSVDLDSLNRQDGIVIEGADPGYMLGLSVRSAGDLNGDGFDDLVVSAPGAAADYTYIYTRFDGYTRFYSTYVPVTYTYTYTGYTAMGASYTEQRTYQGGYTDFSSYYYGTAIQYTYTLARADSGAAYVIFGTDAAPATINVNDLQGDGLTLLGAYSNDMAGIEVAGVGDFNGDGIDDVAVASPETGGSGSGRVYVVFGDDTGLPDEIDLQVLGNDGIVLETAQIDSGFGMVLDGGQDINGDGFGDVIVGAVDADGTYSYTYTRTDGYTRFYSTYITQTYTYTYFGYTTEGASYSEQRTYQAGYTYFSSYYYGFTQTYTGTQPVTGGGQVYVFFGDDALPAGPLDAEDLDGTNGFVFNGRAPGDQAGYDVAFIGDVNGDGHDDALIGAPGAASYGNTDAGEAYVVFGGPGARPANISAFNLNSALGFVVTSDGQGTGLGRTVAGVGDVNGDGIDDFMIVDGLSSGSDTGRAHLVFGVSGTGLQSGLSLDDIDGTVGFTFVSTGVDQATDFAVSVTGADVDGDGYSDIIIGSTGTNGTASTVVISGGYALLLFVDQLDGSADGQIDMAYFDAPNVIGTAQGDALVGVGFDAMMYGRDGNDRMIGGIGNDTIDGGRGRDEIRGGLDNDDIDGGAGFDTIFGGLGDDTVRGGNGDDVINGGGGNDTLDGEQGDDTITGRNGDDDITGGLGNDVISGDNGNDDLHGGQGDDTILGGRGADLIRGGSGADRIEGGTGNDDIAGGGGNDVLFGDDGNDLMRGGAGDDDLHDGAGRDTLSGNAGADTFIFAADGTRDVILDFQDGLDLIDLSNWTVTPFNFDLDFLNDGSMRITVGTEVLRVFADDGGVLDATIIDGDDFIF